MNNDAISRSEVLEIGNVRLVTEYDEAGYYMTYNAVPVVSIERLPALDVAQIVTNGQDTTYLRVKSLDELRGRIVIDEESGNRCAMYYEEEEDVAPVVHARWIHDINNLYGCSACMARETMSHKKPKQFCPECGARMDGEAE